MSLKDHRIITEICVSQDNGQKVPTYGKYVLFFHTVKLRKIIPNEKSFSLILNTPIMQTLENVIFSIQTETGCY